MPLFTQENLAVDIAPYQKEAQRRLALYRQGRPPRTLKGKHVILVDDGIATGLTVEAALRTARAEGTAFLVLAIPIAPPDSLHRLISYVDKVICLREDPLFRAVGCYYTHFDQVSDETVINELGTTGVHSY